MQMEPPASLSELVRDKILHASVNLRFDPTNHLREKVMDKIRVGFRLFHWKTSRPGIARRAKSQRKKPQPTSRHGTLSKSVNERADTIRKTKPAAA
jgi:hypothetical protein